jgi:hypothetical protein
MPTNIVKQVIRTHGKSWQAMTRAKQLRYGQLANDLREERRQATTSRIDKELAVLRSLELQQEEEAASGYVMRLGACRFSDSAITEFNSLYKCDVWSKKHLDDLRAEAVEPIGPPAAPIVAGLEDFDVDGGCPRRLVPAWARWVAVHRAVFRQSIFRFEVEGEQVHLKFIYATQVPTLVCLCRCSPIVVVEPAFDASSYQSAWPNIWDHVFEYDSVPRLFSDDPGLHSPTSIHILQDVVVRAGRRYLFGDGDFVPMELMQTWLLAPTGQAAADEEPRRKPKPVSEPWMEDPMMWDVVRDAGKKLAKGPEAFSDQEEEKENDEADGHEEIDESLEDEVAALDALWDRRAELASDQVADTGAFTYTLRGGTWTHAHRGVAYDSFRALAANGQPQRFCANFGLAKTATFSIAKFGEEHCQALCKAWAHRMHFLYAVWVESGALPTFRFCEADFRCFVRLLDVQRLAGEASVAFRDRLESINGLRPRAA